MTGAGDRPFALRLTGWRTGLAVLALHAMLALGFVGMARAAAMAGGGQSALCLSEPGGGGHEAPGHDVLCALACAARPPALTETSPGFAAPTRRSEAAAYAPRHSTGASYAAAVRPCARGPPSIG